MNSPQQVPFNDVMSQLQPQILDQSRCTPLTSLTEQLKKPAIRNAAINRQRTQFNMANGIYFDDPIEAADYLLKREYGETSVFGKRTDNGPVFIPPSFISGYHRKENAILDYDIPKIVKEMANNLSRDAPAEWFTVEFLCFVENATELKNKDVFKWRRKMKLLDLVRNHGPKVDSALIPGTNNSITNIISECAELMKGADQGNKLSLEFFTFPEKKVKPKQWLTDLIKKFPLTSDSWALSWLYKLDENVSGEEAERWVFDGLQKCVKQEDFVVLRGADIKLEADQREMDFLIFSGQRKIVIGLEVKYSYRERAVGQLMKNYYKILEERFGDIIGGWTFIPICCFYDQSTLPPDSNPEAKYVITGSTDMNAWWDSICLEYPSTDSADEQAQRQLQDVLKLIVFTFHVGEPTMGGSGFVTPTKIVGEVSKAIEIVSTASNILFYSKNQLQIMNGNYANVLLKSSYGTGKTFLMFEKAKELARRGEKVAFILDMMFGKLRALELPEEHRNITVFNGVISVRGDCDTLMPSKLLKHANSHPKSHIFVDDWRFSPNGKGVADFESLLQAMKGKHFWVSLSRETSIKLQNNVGEDWKALDKVINDNFVIPQLEYSMRNSAEIMRAAKALNHPNIPVALPPYNIPQGLAPEHFSINASQKNDRKAVERVFKAAYDAARLRTDKGILVIVSGLSDPKVLVESARSVVPINELCTYFVTCHDGTMFDQVIPFLRENKGVLISDALACQGIGWDCVICFCGNDNPRAEPFQSLCKWYMRCRNHLIIIECEEEANVLDLI